MIDEFHSNLGLSYSSYTILKDKLIIYVIFSAFSIFIFSLANYIICVNSRNFEISFYDSCKLTYHDVTYLMLLLK